jgi:Subunit ChlI of Mg-chelatase
MTESPPDEGHPEGSERQPAARTGAGPSSLDQPAGVRRAALERLHGVGSKALRTIQDELENRADPSLTSPAGGILRSATTRPTVHFRACIRRFGHLTGCAGQPVSVEVHVSNGLPGFTNVGLPDASVRKAGDRVRTAMLSSGFAWPLRKTVVNLAPSKLQSGNRGVGWASASLSRTRWRSRPSENLCWRDADSADRTPGVSDGTPRPRAHPGAESSGGRTLVRGAARVRARPRLRLLGKGVRGWSAPDLG